MCGICGIRRFGPTPITPDQINILLIQNEKRGMQATGVALQQADGSIQVWKKDEPAWRFVVLEGFKSFIKDNLREDTLTFIGHTRAATKGLPCFDKNNHPMWSGVTAMTHNGVIHNDDELFREFKLERGAETDSDIIRAILDWKGFTREGLTTLNRVRGSAAFAAISTKYPGKLILARSGSPLQLAATKDQMLWSSEREPIMHALRKYEKKFGVWMKQGAVECDYMPMNNDSAYLFSDKPEAEEGVEFDPNDSSTGDWLEWHQEFKSAMTYTTPNYRAHDTYNGTRVRNYGETKIDIIMCPNKKCAAWLPINPAQLVNLKSVRCGKCKTKLAA